MGSCHTRYALSLVFNPETVRTLWGLRVTLTGPLLFGGKVVGEPESGARHRVPPHSPVTAIHRRPGIKQPKTYPLLSLPKLCQRITVFFFILFVILITLHSQNNTDNTENTETPHVSRGHMTRGCGPA